MQELMKKMNPIPVKTWRWLGVNEVNLEETIPTIMPYHKSVLKTKIPDGVVVTEDHKTRQDYAALAGKIAAGVSEPMEQFVALNENSGHLVTIAKDAKVTEPIVFHYEFDPENPTVIDQQVVVAEEDSEATIILCYTGESAAFHSGLTKVYAKKGAKIHIIKVQLLNDQSLQFDGTGSVVEAGARVDFTLVELGSKCSVTNHKTSLNGKEAEGKVYSIYFGDQSRKIDINYVMTFLGKQVNGEIISRGALLDESQKIFRGTLDFVTGSRGAVGKEEEYTVLLSPKVRNRSIPLMLCSEADVEGQHAASTGQMDEEQLFYLMSRGISEIEAKKLIIEASFQPIIDKIPVAAIQEAIGEFIRRRLAHVG
ncbi:MAG: Fe-S cluster assembly protein SufD [Sporomusaceae bacterium]|nr:Fe-S cluster assembly protein SufD [Sporomusaceae bacterium]